MKSYYIASGLENAEQVKAVKARLDAAGWHHTYDWTVHGSVQREGIDRLHEVSSAESVGVFEAQMLIVLLPGGRGTHSELGMQIGKMDSLVWMTARGVIDLDLLNDVRCVHIYSPNPDDFSTENGKTCAFYFHPYTTRWTDLDEMIRALTGGEIQ